MIKYEVTVKKFTDKGFKKIVNVYGEKELNAALQNIAGIVTECLVAKNVALDTIVLEKIIGEERKVLLHYYMDEFSYAYVIRNL